MFTHLVLFKLRPDMADKAGELCARLETLPAHVPVIRQLEAGVDVLRSERSFDVALIVRLDSRADLDVYQNHPYHQEVLAYVRSVISEAKAVDW